MSIDIWRVISNKLPATHLTTNFCRGIPRWERPQDGIQVVCRYQGFLCNLPDLSFRCLLPHHPSRLTHIQRCPVLSSRSPKEALPSSPPGKASPLHGSVTHFLLSPCPLSASSTALTLGLWALAITLNVYYGCLWRAVWCVVFIFFLIFSDIFFFFSYKVIFPTIFFVSGKNNCQCLKKKWWLFYACPSC